MITRLIDKRLVGLADACPVPEKRVRMLNSVAKTHLNKPSSAEKRMLFHLNCLTRLCKRGIRYRREVPIHLADNIGRVVDIRFRLQRLVIEFDGKQHLRGLSPEWDSWRDELLSQQGTTVLRIPNEIILNDIGKAILLVVDALLRGRHMGREAQDKLREIAASLHESSDNWSAFVDQQLRLDRR